VAAAGVLDGVHGQETDGVDAKLVEIGGNRERMCGIQGQIPFNPVRRLVGRLRKDYT